LAWVVLALWVAILPLAEDNMTLSTLRTYCRAHGLTARKTPYGKYRVTIAVSPSPANHAMAERIAYYTTDIQDAYDTAAAMTREPSTNQRENED
jgi:ABC-type uncharacterized transport system involved in gliding motility auxiliary subunit